MEASCRNVDKNYGACDKRIGGSIAHARYQGFTYKFTGDTSNPGASDTGASNAGPNSTGNNCHTLVTTKMN